MSESKPKLYQATPNPRSSRYPEWNEIFRFDQLPLESPGTMKAGHGG